MSRRRVMAGCMGLSRATPRRSIALAGEAPLEEHLARYRAADLFLDTLPYNAHATAAEIAPVKKTLRFDTADHPEIVGKIEGMALLGDGAVALINDDDFGITGARTQIAVVRGTGIARR